MTVYMKDLENDNLIKFMNINKVLVSEHTSFTMWLLVCGEARESFCSDKYRLVEVSDLAVDKEDE